jgi:hypothetical protein
VFVKSAVLLSAILFILLLPQIPAVYGQWSVVEPPSISTDWELLSVHRTSSTVGWAVGRDLLNHEAVLLFLSGGGWVPVSPPVVSANWELRNVHFPVSNEGWAVGADFVNTKGVLLHRFAGSWSLDTTPLIVSQDWDLVGVHFTSSTQGWAVGSNLTDHKGVLLRFINGDWFVVTDFIDVGSTDWGLFGVHFTSVSEGWAVGLDSRNSKGVLLHYTGSWVSVSPPTVSASWALYSTHFTSATEGWAVGEDFTNRKGVILHHVNGVWTSVAPPDVSSDWALYSVQFISSTEGWAVGQDFVNARGVLLHYTGGTWESVLPPDAGTDWALSSVHFIASDDGWAVGEDFDGLTRSAVILRYSIPDISVSPSNLNFRDVTIGSVRYLTTRVTNNGNGNLVIGTLTDPAAPFTKHNDKCSGETLSSQQFCSVIYRFEPTSEGDFNSNSNIPSNDPDENPVTLTLRGTGIAGEPLYINLVSPIDGQNLAACSYYNPPLFQWDSSGDLRSLQIQFSLEPDFLTISKKAGAKPGVNELQIASRSWNGVLRLPGLSGGTVYWRVVGMRADRTKVESDVFSLVIEGPAPVSTPQIMDTSKSTLPTLSWENNCAKKFKVWFGNDPDFTMRTTKKRAVSFTDADPTDSGGTFTATLSSRQWSTVRGVVGDLSGSTIYWYVESWDQLRRYGKTGVMNFVLTD